MQTTLLGLAITVILALVAALVGPLFVDWNGYRPQFEAEASRLIGLPVRVNGSVDVRLLPSPSLILGGIEIGQPGADSGLKARALGVEFALGPLMRGQLRAAQTRIIGPEFTLGLDHDGRVVFPKAASGFALDALSIDRLNIDDARLVLANAASGTHVTLDKFWFHGEVRSLAGAFKGEGAFILNGSLYGYRIATARPDDSGVKAKFSVDPSDRPISAEGEGVITLDNGTPRFEGVLSFARAAGAVLTGGQAIMNEPVRVSTRVKANSTSALLEQIEFQYGPEERAVKLTGTAELKFGAQPRFDGVLSARQLDLDRLTVSADSARRLPFAALAALKNSFGNFLRPPVPTQIGIGIDNVTLSGAALQSLRGDLKADATGWSLDHVEFRAPGSTQVQLSGKIDGTGAATFAGPVDIAAADPRALLAWLDGRGDGAVGAIRPFRIRGDVTLGAAAIGVERLRAEIDRKTLEGRLGYSFASGDRKARLDAELRAPDFDADALLDFGKAVLGDKTFDRPGELSLALDLDRATIAGFEAKNVDAKFEFDGGGLRIDRLAVADFGGTGLSASGRIDTSGDAPRGDMTLDLDAREWSGINALAAKFAPQSADAVRRLTGRIGVAKLRASLDVGKEATGTPATLARMMVEGNVGSLRVNLRAQGQGEAKALASSQLRLDVTVDSADSAELIRALSLDNIVPAQPGGGQLKLIVYGPADGELTLGARLSAGDFFAESHGSARANFDQGITASLGLLVTKNDAQRTLPAPFTFQSRIAVAGGVATFTDIAASVSKTRLSGRLEVKLARPFVVSGKIVTDALDVPAIIDAAMGMPQPRGDGAWQSDPFTQPSLPDVVGRVEFQVAQGLLGSALTVRDMSGALRLSASEVALENLAGSVAGGRFTGDTAFRRTGDGVSMQVRLSLKGSDATTLVTSGEAGPIAGRLGLQIEMEGIGLTPKALIGSLNGSGTVTLEKAEIAKLDPRAFATAMRAVDQGMALDTAKIRDVVGQALDAGRLKLDQAEGAIAITNGQVRLGTVIAQADGADLAMSGNVDLVERTLDARMMLTATSTTTSAGRPELSIALKGPLSAPQRTLDVSALAGWLALRAVEQQSKRLEAIEAERAGGRSTTQSIAPAMAPSAPPAAKAASQAAPLPPPLEIRPLPRPADAPRPQTKAPSERDRFMNQFGSQR